MRNEKKTRTYNVFNERLSARELFYAGQLHISERTNKAVHIKLYKLLGVKSGAIMEENGSFDEHSNEIFVQFLL